MSTTIEGVKTLSPWLLVLVTALAMLAFAANSLLCRAALASGEVGASSFTVLRIVSGAVVLALLLVKRRTDKVGGSWLAAAALFGYAAAFSYAYISLSAATGALLLFGAVQVTMIVYGLWCGERLTLCQVIGALAAAAGLVWLMLPGVQSPPLLAAMLMLGAGFSWGAYSLLGRGARVPTAATAGNFLRALPLGLVLYLLLGRGERANALGVGYAVASGALASALGYALWYRVLPALSATTAATVQLSVPVLAALGGVLLLGEPMTVRFGLASMAVLGGIALFVLNRRSG